MNKQAIKIGVAGAGALGSIVCRAILKGEVTGYTLVGIADLNPSEEFDVPVMGFDELAAASDIVVEALPAVAVPELAREVLLCGKTLVMVSACALLLYPEIEEMARESKGGKIIVPSGALSGLDAVAALGCAEIDSATIASTKPPKGLKGAPYVIEQNLDLDSLNEKTRIFSGNATSAAQAFPANVNVAATLSLAGIGAERTMVEVWADPNAQGNCHEITVIGGSSTIVSRVENKPDPSNPKSSVLAGYSLVAWLKKQSQAVSIA